VLRSRLEVNLEVDLEVNSFLLEFSNIFIRKKIDAIIIL